jgi:hypothetical protein
VSTASSRRTASSGVKAEAEKLLLLRRLLNLVERFAAAAPPMGLQTLSPMKASVKLTDSIRRCRPTLRQRRSGWPAPGPSERGAAQGAKNAAAAS